MKRKLVDPLSGKRLSESAAIDRVEQLYFDAEQAAREAHKAYNRARRGAKLPETRERHADELAFWRNEVAQLERAANQLQREVLRAFPVELPPAPRESKRLREKREEVEREDEERDFRQRQERERKEAEQHARKEEARKEAAREEARAARGVTATEWELGVEYRPSPDRKRQGKGWPVDVNIRVRRDDGEAMGRDEVLGVMAYWIRTGVERAGYDIHAIDWRTPGKSWTTGERAEAGDNLRGPIIAALDTQRFRLGAVDDDV